MIRLFSATLLSLLLCASLANAAEKPLIVASDATWPPSESYPGKRCSCRNETLCIK